MNECLRFLLGKAKISSNMFRKCIKKGIGDPRLMTVDLLQAEMFIYEKKLEELKT